MMRRRTSMMSRMVWRRGRTCFLERSSPGSFARRRRGLSLRLAGIRPHTAALPPSDIGAGSKRPDRTVAAAGVARATDWISAGNRRACRAAAEDASTVPHPEMVRAVCTRRLLPQELNASRPVAVGAKADAVHARRAAVLLEQGDVHRLDRGALSSQQLVHSSFFIHSSRFLTLPLTAVRLAPGGCMRSRDECFTRSARAV